jgi:ABC-type uncharacterized transport system permease subunit
VAIELHQLAAALYLVATAAALAGISLPQARFGRAARWLLGAGALAQAFAMARFHTLPHPPLLTHLPSAVSFSAWLAVLVCLWLMRRSRFDALAALVAPAAFGAVFFASLSLRSLDPAPPADMGSWPHLHVLLAMGGLSLLGVAGLAGALFLAEARALKSKRPRAWRSRLPSLEALDRVNAAALATGFPLLSAGVVAGMLWTQGETGELWVGGAHAIWSVVAWAIYAALAIARFGAGWRGREAAASAAFGFVFLLFVVVGVGAVR